MSVLLCSLKILSILSQTNANTAYTTKTTLIYVLVNVTHISDAVKLPK